MADPDDTEGSSGPIEDPEWIKGLVAKALLQAAEEEPVTTTPEGAPLVIGRSSRETIPAPSLAAESDNEPPTSSAVTAEPPETLAPDAGGDDPGVSTESETQIPADGGDTAAAAFFGGVGPDGAAPAVEAEFGVRDDHVMVEEDATTEGFRSSDIRTVLEWLAVIVSALVVALVIKAFVLQAFWIPSESMESTVNKGDRILVNKLSYRLHDIRRGDLVVFKKLPGTPGDTEDLIKRAIALPGETLEVREDGRIYIWGPGETADDALLLREPYLDPNNATLPVPRATDALSSDIWDENCTNQPRTPGRCSLGPDQFFMMGDNRNASSDSRFFGPVDGDLVVGRAFLRIWPLGQLSSL